MPARSRRRPSSAGAVRSATTLQRCPSGPVTSQAARRSPGPRRSEGEWSGHGRPRYRPRPPMSAVTTTDQGARRLACARATSRCRPTPSSRSSRRRGRDRPRSEGPGLSQGQGAAAGRAAAGRPRGGARRGGPPRCSATGTRRRFSEAGVATGRRSQARRVATCPSGARRSPSPSRSACVRRRRSASGKGVEVGRARAGGDRRGGRGRARPPARVARVAGGGRARRPPSGDFVVMDFVGSVDGEPFEGGEARGFLLELGSGRLIEGFEAQLEGASAGEERTVEVTLPRGLPGRAPGGQGGDASP